MNAHVYHRPLAVAALLVLLLTGCGQEEASDTSPTPEPITPESLAAALLTPEDLGEGWSTSIPPDAPEAAESGVVTDEMREFMPRIELCAAAPEEAQAAADSLEWQAFRQLDLATDVPPHDPGSKAPPQHHLVFVQEFLTSGDDTEATYDALVTGLEACEGVEETTKDGESVTTSALDVPTLGDAASAWRTVVLEPGPEDRSATWDLRTVLVRDGEVFVNATVAEITTEKVQPEIDDDRVVEIVTQMVDKLP